MSTAEQWAETLGREPEGFRLQFQRLGLEAECRPLRSEEVEECRRMGGERGLRYALYLSCDALRQAGEQMKQQGALALSFDITQRLAYGDILAAGGAVLEQSGAGGAQVRLLADGQEVQNASVQLHSDGEYFWKSSSAAEELTGTRETGLPAGTASGRLLRTLFSPGQQEQSGDAVMALAQVFAERLASAAANS